MLCLGLPFLLAGHVWIIFVPPGIAILWFFLKRRSGFWSTSSLLFAAVFLAALGITINLPLPWMVLGCTASLAAWDLANFRQGVHGNSSSPQEVSLERSHMQSLAMAVVAGLVFVFIGSLLSLQISFAITAFLILVAVGCLTYGVQTVIKNH